jgi:hypothetical protein
MMSFIPRKKIFVQVEESEELSKMATVNPSKISPTKRSVIFSAPNVYYAYLIMFI